MFTGIKIIEKHFDASLLKYFLKKIFLKDKIEQHNIIVIWNYYDILFALGVVYVI